VLLKRAANLPKVLLSQPQQGWQSDEEASEEIAKIKLVDLTPPIWNPRCAP